MKKKKSNRRKIMDATTRLIIERGVHNISLSDIAERVGISKGTLYYYYPSKSNLIFDITEEHMEHMSQRLLRWVDSIKGEMTSAEILSGVYRKILNDTTRAKLHIYLMQEAVTANSDLQERFREEYLTWRKVLFTGLQKILDPAEYDIEILSHLVLTSMTGTLIQNMFEITDIPIDRMVGTLLGKH